MVSGNDNPPPKSQSDAVDSQLPSYESGDRQFEHVREGLYILTNKKARSTLDLAGGDARPGTLVLGFEQHIERDNPNQLWLIKRDGAKDTYTFRNLLSGTCLDLEGGNRDDGSRVVGRPRERRADGRVNQEWHIEKREPHYYAIRCSQTNTFLEIPGGDPTDCVVATCSRASEQADHQRWALELASCTGAEIRTLFSSWKPNLLPQLFQLFRESAQYFILRNNVRRSIWETTKLRTQLVHSHFFDYDAFVIRMKDAAANWARNRFKADIDGYSILFGIIYGEAQKGPRAYNWYLSPDMTSLVFFDPQSGREYGPAALDGFGFEPTFAMF